MEHLIRTKRYDDETRTLFDVTYCGLEDERTGPSELRGPGESWAVERCAECVKTKDALNDTTEG